MWRDMMWRDMMWYDVTWCDVILCDVIWCDVILCDVIWCEVLWFDVIWCDVILCDVIWCDMMWRDVIWCDVMWRDVMRHDVTWYDVIWWQLGWWHSERSSEWVWLAISKQEVTQWVRRKGIHWVSESAWERERVSEFIIQYNTGWFFLNYHLKQQFRFILLKFTSRTYQVASNANTYYWK